MTRLGKSVAQNVGIARHRLRLNDDVHFRIIKRETVIHVSVGHVEFRSLNDDEFPRRDRSRPLLTYSIDALHPDHR